MSAIFLPRADPLPAVAIAALGPHIATLARKALSLPDEALTRLTGVAGPKAAVLLGATDALPWFDGALYLAANGGLLFPTWAEPAMHPLLLERALRRTLQPATDGPLAILIPSLTGAQRPLVLPVGEARPLSRAKLTALAEGA
jgi:hypothetical protein